MKRISLSDHEGSTKNREDPFMRHATSPGNIGTLEAPTGWAYNVGECGDSVEVCLLAEGGRISDIRILPKGCVHTLACSSALGELVDGKTLEMALEVLPEDVERALGGLPEAHAHCARLVVNTLGEAIAEHFRKAAAGLI